MNQPAKPTRSFLGKVIKWTFILFNIGMLVWLIGGVSGAASETEKISDEAERTGAEVGTTIGAMMIIFIWMAGALILGIMTYFTKAKKS